MWKTVLPDHNASWEPLELRSLKRQLANLNCKCKSCDRSKELQTYRLAEEQKDTEVQAVQSKGYLDSFVQATGSQPFHKDIKPHSYFPNSIRDDISCPSCYVTLSLLRSGLSRVFKDEEVETKPEMFSCDKSTEKIINSLEKTTSLTIRPALKYSNQSLSEQFMEQSSQGTMSPPRKCGHREVTFLLDKKNESLKENEPNQNSFDTLIGNCICLDDYMNCVRPPWID